MSNSIPQQSLEAYWSWAQKVKSQGQRVIM